MTFWIMFTMVVGTLFGGIAAALVRPKVTAEVQVDVAQPPVEAQAETSQPAAEVQAEPVQHPAEADEDVAPASDDDPEKAEDTP
jgi:hypothetical protein